MCATATAILHWNAIPIFCDIDQDTFGLDYNLIESKITKKLKLLFLWIYMASLPKLTKLWQ